MNEPIPIEPMNRSLKENVVITSTIGTCCASGVYGMGCLKCAGCVVGSVGCAIGTQACYDCTKQNIQDYRKQSQENDPNYDPRGASVLIDKNKGNSSTSTKRIRTRDIINYIKTNTNGIYNNMTDTNIKLAFELNDTYNEPYHIFKKNDKPAIDALIGEAIYKKAVGVRKNKRTQRKIKRTTMRKYKLKGKKKIVHTFRKI